MRAVAVLCVWLAAGGVASGALATDAFAKAKIRLAQSFTTTTCLMGCNSQLATCQSTCLAPAAATNVAPTAATTSGTLNASATVACSMTCTNTQLACQANCARASPSP
jgi:hypothetical protein